MSETAHQDHIEKKAFLVNTSSLKEVRIFVVKYLKNFKSNKI